MLLGLDACGGNDCRATEGQRDAIIIESEFEARDLGSWMLHPYRRSCNGHSSEGEIDVNKAKVLKA